ncbi:hypothetical protein ACHAWF_016781, partial [Thalassiosira exigua]
LSHLTPHTSLLASSLAPHAHLLTRYIPTHLDQPRSHRTSRLTPGPVEREIRRRCSYRRRATRFLPVVFLPPSDHRQGEGVMSDEACDVDAEGSENEESMSDRIIPRRQDGRPARSFNNLKKTVFSGAGRRCLGNASIPPSLHLCFVTCLFNVVMKICTFVAVVDKLPGGWALSPTPQHSQRQAMPSPSTSSVAGRWSSHACVKLTTSKSCPLLSSHSSSLSPEVPPLIQKAVFPDARPFNNDIARTLFAPLFFSLHRFQNADQSNESVRYHYQRPSPIEDPSSARTAERMLRRMMENRHRSNGRTVCPDGRTFNLVAGAYGRLRCGKKSGGDFANTVTWEEEHIAYPFLNNTPDENVSGLSLSKIQTPVIKLQQLLHLQLKLSHREGWRGQIIPSVGIYNRVLKRLAWQSRKYYSNKHDDCFSAAEQAWLWLQFMKSPSPWDRITDEDVTCMCEPNPFSYAHVIDALSSHRAPTSQSENEETKPPSSEESPPVPGLRSIEELAKEINVPTTVAEPPADATPEWYLKEAEKILLILEDGHNKLTSDNGSTECGWDQHQLQRALAQGYRSLSEGWGRYAVSTSSADARDSDSNEIGSDNLSPRNREEAINRAHELLCRLEELASTGTPLESALLPHSSCYSSVILALSTSNVPSAASVAEGVLQRMMSQYRTHERSGLNTQPFFSVKDLSTAFSGCIAAHAKNNDAPGAENVLNQMLDLYESEKLGSEFVPEVRAFGTCIALWSKYSPGHVQTNTKKQSQKMPKRHGKGLPSHEQRLQNADRAEAILVQLEHVADAEAIKGSESFPYNIAILARVQTVSENSRTISEYGANDQAILHAQSILDHMEYEMGVSPDPYTYSILLNAWCKESSPKNEKAADYAEELLRRRIEDVDIDMIDIDSLDSRSANDIWPNAKHYSSVLKAHAKTKSAGGAKKALGLLSEMEQRYYHAKTVKDDSENVGLADYHIDRKDVAKPDLVCYSIVIDAFAKSRLPDASSVAQRLLRAVESKFDAGDTEMKPNTRLYTAVISSLIHSNEEGGDINKAQHAWSILERMKKNDVLPNSFTYNYIINCAAQAGGSSEDKRKSFQISLEAFQELRKASKVEPDVNGSGVDPCHPDSFTFAFMLKAVKNLLPPGSVRTKIATQTFRECCRAGYVNDAVLDRLWHSGIPSEKFHELTQRVRHKRITSFTGRTTRQRRSPIGARQLPQAWTRCCR